MHTITSQQNAQLGPTPVVEVHVEGCPVTALLDTGSPATIISLDFLLQTLAKQKKPGETPQAWRERIEKQLEPPSIPLRSYGGQPLSIVGQVLVNICRGDTSTRAKVHIQQGAPVCVLIGTDVLPKLGFVLLESDSGGIATDCLKWKRECETTERSTVSTDYGHDDCSPGTVKLITTTKVPARHVRVVKAKLDGVSRGSVALLDGEIKLKERGLRIAESLLEPDGEHCVRIPIENVSCESVCLESGVLLGQIEPVTSY
jgi:hypothetical protein